MTKNKWWYSFKETLFLVALIHVAINLLRALLERSLEPLNMIDVLDLQYFFPAIQLNLATFFLSGIPAGIAFLYFLNKWQKGHKVTKS